MDRQVSLLKAVEKVAKGELSPPDVFARLAPLELAKIVHPYFSDTHDRILAVGEGLLEGDVSGYLVLGRDVAAAIRQAAPENGGAPYVYSIADGGIDDFAAIGGAVGFFTSHPGNTTFSPVQSVSEGIPTIIGVPVEYHESDESVVLMFATHTGMQIAVTTRKRWITTRSETGEVRKLAEGDLVSLSGESGLLFAGRQETVTSGIDELYQILTDAYLEAEATWGAPKAWSRIHETRTYEANREYVERVLRSDLFIGFQKLRDYALENSPLRVLVNVHNTGCVVKARLLAARLSGSAEGLRIDVDETRYGVGLLRDERMWTDDQDIDVLRILLLGEECTDSARYACIASEYAERHGQKYLSLFCARPGATCVVRTLCMPLSKFLPDTFDLHAFAKKHGLDLEKVNKAFQQIRGEREVYHGCRGIRLFSIRPDLMRLWLKTVLAALKRAHDNGVQVRIRFLLATLTLPEEARRFIGALEDVADQVFGAAEKAPVDGVATMLETSGAYINLEQILAQHGRVFKVNGGLIGSNDFTTACLNMNRGDAPRYLIPKYIETGLFPASPFRHIYAPVVGRAMHTALQRSTSYGLQTERKFFWGLAGELTTNWQSVQWLSTYLGPVGLDYISTSPDTIIAALFAAMCSRSQLAATPSAA